ncbi:alpha/beta hydrolase [Micromonospora sp. 15K316]|uniref:alpha/beta fold hydrolase n=1 Tax=Micromonospora sp. 15K316 TaxID=2530376 RepID=UPI001044008D|nr:alpha/beta hydrolase [Micromonospora sp. 15K316]TDC40391.1 alpha/beta hydrolase [Micromonospora sp. 15K316]
MTLSVLRHGRRRIDSGPPRRTRSFMRKAIASVAAAAAVLFVGASSSAAADPYAEPLAGKANFSSSFQHGMVRVDGGQLHYVKGGSGPALVLLHGWPQTWWAWHDVMPALARNHTVIAFDLPGLGDSSSFATGYDKVTTAQRIRQAVHALGHEQVSILAHDVGVLVAYPYAREFPNEVTRIAVLDSTLSGFGLEDAYTLSFHFLFNAAPAPIPERILDNEDVPTYLGMIFDFSVNPAAIDREVYYRFYRDPADRTAGYNYYRAYAGDAENNRANASSRLTMPVLAMGSAATFGPAVAGSFRQVADDVREVVVTNSGHFIPEENPEFLISCLNLFTGVTAAPPSAELANCAA